EAAPQCWFPTLFVAPAGWILLGIPRLLGDTRTRGPRILRETRIFWIFWDLGDLDLRFLRCLRLRVLRWSLRFLWLLRLLGGGPRCQCLLLFRGCGSRGPILGGTAVGVARERPRFVGLHHP